MGFSRQEHWSGCHFLLQGISLTQGWKLHVLHQQTDSLPLGHQWKWVTVTQSCPLNSAGQNTGVDGLSLLQAIFPTQGSIPGLLHCRWILYHLSHQGSPRILEWVAYPFSNISSWPRNWTRVSCIAGRFLPAKLPGKPHILVTMC